LKLIYSAQLGTEPDW